ncbi:MAG: lipoyl(octanoyl) transferase LipB, partial [bacterium]|nr:lipoyl(octanoyl) transferase LipB [bacterium]
MSELVYVDLGQCNYRDTLALQHRLVDRVRSSDDDRAYLILVEHAPAVITLGRRAKAEHILDTEAAELIESRRGGDVTWHGPGQLVAYPIVRLSGRRKRLSGYVRNLEEAVIALLAKFDLNAGRQSGQVGVWIDGQKISAIGVAVKRWITYHGLALNVSADLRGFDAIVPCGIQDASITSISQLLGRDVPISQVKDMLIETLAQTLEFDCRRRATPQELKTPRKRLPHWLRREIPTGSNISEVQTLIEKLNLSTVCQSAHCPNRVECFSQRTATFMI